MAATALNHLVLNPTLKPVLILSRVIPYLHKLQITERQSAFDYQKYFLPLEPETEKTLEYLGYSGRHNIFAHLTYCLLVPFQSLITTSILGHVCKWLNECTNGSQWDPAYQIGLMVLGHVEARLNPVLPPPSPFPIQVTTNPTKQYETLFKKSKLSDISFDVNGKIIHAHKILLFVKSKFFKKLFTTTMKECGSSVIPIKEISAPVFEILIKSIYFKEIEVNSIPECLQLIFSANRFQLIEFETQLVNALSAAQLEIGHFVELWECCQSLSLVKLESGLLRWVARNWMQFVQPMNVEKLQIQDVMGKLVKLFETLVKETSSLDDDWSDN